MDSEFVRIVNESRDVLKDGPRGGCFYDMAEYSSVIADALRGSTPYRPPKRADMILPGGMPSGALITPVTFMPASQNPLLGENNEEEFTCLDGDEQASEMYDKLVRDDEKGCVYCEHGMCKHELSRAELDQIHSLEEQHYGTMSDKSMYGWISEEYKQKIHKPLSTQQKVRNDKRTREGLAPINEEIPEWPAESVAKHFEKDGLYLHRELGDDIRVCKGIQKNLQYHGIAKKRKSGGKDVDAERVKLWKELSKHKSELIVKMHGLYPNIVKRQKKDTESVKPSGTR